jgi:phage-related tail protein
MSVRIRQTILTLGVAVPVAMSLATPASAGLFDGIGKAVGGVTKTVSRAVGGAAKDVSRTVTKVTKPVGRAVGSATRDVGRAASSVSRDVGRAATSVSRELQPKNLGKTYMKIARPVGAAVSTYYNVAGKIAKKVPLVGPGGEAIAKEISKAARTKEAQIGAGVAASVALAGGGTAALRYIGTAAGGGGMTGYYGKKGYDAGKRQVRESIADFKKNAR